MALNDFKQFIFIDNTSPSGFTVSLKSHPRALPQGSWVPSPTEGSWVPLFRYAGRSNINISQYRCVNILHIITVSQRSHQPYQATKKTALAFYILIDYPIGIVIYLFAARNRQQKIDRGNRSQVIADTCYKGRYISKQR